MSIRLESVGLVKIIYYYSKMVVSRNALDRKNFLMNKFFINKSLLFFYFLKAGLQILVPKNAYNACRLVRHAYL